MSYVKIGDILIGSNTRIMLTKVEDSAGGSVSRRETKYAECDGMEYSDITFNPRAVAVHGTLFGESVSDVKMLMRNLTRTCTPMEKAQIYYHNGDREYFAEAYPSQLPVYSKVNNHTYKFIVYLDLFNFWWLSPSEITEAIFVRSDNIKGILTLPMAFTIRQQGADIYNNGAVAAPLVINISIHESFSQTLIIKNVTYDLSVVIENYSFTAGEIISLNMGVSDEYTVTSSVNGNIVKYLSEDSEFFNLERGYNRLECDQVRISMVANYRERFLGV